MYFPVIWEDVKPELFFLLSHVVALRRPYIKFRFFRYTSVTCLYMCCSMKNEKYINTYQISNIVKGYFYYKSTFCHKVALDVYTYNYRFES